MSEPQDEIVETSVEVVVVETPSETLVRETVVIRTRERQNGPLEAFTGLLPIITVAIFIVTFLAQPYRIPSGSMEKTLLIGDFLLVNKQVYAPGGAWHWLMPYREPKRGDIIVFHNPLDANDHLVKRTIGLPNERLRLRGGRVLVNDRPLDEPYTYYIPSRPDHFRDNFPTLHDADPEIDAQWWMQMRTLIFDGDLVIPQGDFFMMGDNRNNSRDSRYWGFMPRDFAEGTPMLVYFSVPAPKEQQKGIQGIARWRHMFTVPR